MPPRLPPLNALRAFESSARHSSFVRAAAELGVTAAAVSQQVKQLEAYLGVRLFQRRPRGLALTDAARGLLPELTEGFERLLRATGQARRVIVAGRLTVTTLASFAAGWLVPRLADFRRRYPEVELALRTERQVLDFARDDVDLAIRFGRGVFPRLKAVPFLEEVVFPVCAPGLLGGAAPPGQIADLPGWPLLHDLDAEPNQPWMSWPAWFGRAGLDAAAARPGLYFNDSMVLIAAALAGHGVALGREPLLGDHLETGRLVRLLPDSWRAAWSYYLVAPEPYFRRPPVRALVQWLLAERDRGS